MGIGREEGRTKENGLIDKWLSDWSIKPRKLEKNQQENLISRIRRHEETGPIRICGLPSHQTELKLTISRNWMFRVGIIQAEFHRPAFSPSKVLIRLTPANFKSTRKLESRQLLHSCPSRGKGLQFSRIVSIICPNAFLSVASPSPISLVLWPFGSY